LGGLEISNEGGEKMLPFRKILCPTDFSESSYEAVRAAGELASYFGSDLCIIHVVPPVPVIPVGAEPTAFNISMYEQELEASSKKSLQEVVDQLESKELKVRLIVLRGNAADEIIRTADEEDVDLIVIATRGRTGLDRLIFGSVAEKVVRLARCPVFTVTSRPLKEKKQTHSQKGERNMTGEVRPPEEKKEMKQAYQEKIEAQLREWGAVIDQLKAKAEKSRAEVRIKYEKQIQDLRKRQEAVQEKLQELKKSGEETWGELKKGFEKNLDEMKEALDRAVSRFKEKQEEMADKVSKKKETYAKKIDAQLREWGTQIDILKVKAGKAKAGARGKYLEQIEELRGKQKAAKQRLRELKGSGDEAWEDFKDGVEHALGDLKRALKRATSRFK
jgi:nucleotide-binding universal stress UspA family protein